MIQARSGPSSWELEEVEKMLENDWLLGVEFDLKILVGAIRVEIIGTNQIFGMLKFLRKLTTNQF